jgi:hypothetical protein
LLPQPDTPARSPADYAIPDGLLGDLSDPVALVNGRGLQSLLWSAGLPAHEGASLLQAIKDASRNADPDMSDEAFDLRAKETERVLKRQLGEPEYTRRRDALTALLTEMDKKSNGELSDLLGDNAVVLTDPMVMMKLLAHAGRADKRRRG